MAKAGVVAIFSIEGNRLLKFFVRFVFWEEESREYFSQHCELERTVVQMEKGEKEKGFAQ